MGAFALLMDILILDAGY